MELVGDQTASSSICKALSYRTSDCPSLLLCGMDGTRSPDSDTRPHQNVFRPCRSAIPLHRIVVFLSRALEACAQDLWRQLKRLALPQRFQWFDLNGLSCRYITRKQRQGRQQQGCANKQARIVG